MKAVVLCYHKIGPAAEEGRRLNVEPERLKQHVSYFRRRGFEFVRARELASGWPKRVACFSFDDAYVSALTFGMDALERFDVRGSFYAVASLVGQSSSWDGDQARPLADWDLLLDAQRRGHEIGNHSLTHPKLAELEPQEALREIVQADRLLRDRGITASSFCYPYGSENRDVRAAVASVGYSVGLALKKRLPTDADDRLALPRVVVGYSDGVPGLLYKLYMRPMLRKIGI